MTPTQEEKLAATRARLGELAHKFTDRTRGEIEVIRARLAALGAGDTAALGEIRHLAHRMCGTGATLGFERLSEYAASLEKLAGSQKPEVIPENAVLAGLEAAVARIEAELDRQGGDA